jgi:hypothetical protein
MKAEIIEYICKCIVACVGIYCLSTCVAKVEPKHIYLETKTIDSCVTVNVNGDGDVSTDK